MTIKTGTVGINAKGREDSMHELQITGSNTEGELRNQITMQDNCGYYMHYNADGVLVSIIRLHDAGAGITVYSPDGEKVTSEISMSNTSGVTIKQNDANGDGKVSITMHPTNGLGVWFGGVGYNGLGFVNDGNGHAVLGK